MNQSALPTRLLLAVTFLGLTVSVGCQSTGATSKYNPFAALIKSDSDSKSSKTGADKGMANADFGKPVRMAVLWNETAISPPAGGDATRGFGGRVYFYDANNEAVRVDGQLHVYAYDDTKEGSESQRVPDREYIFKAEKLQARFSETSIGPSYNVWLPWDQMGGFRKTITLLPIFKADEGGVVRAEQSLAILPGKEPANSIEEFDSNRSMVRQVSAVIDGNESVRGSLVDGRANNLANRRKTTTIRVPKRLANRMRQAKRGSYARSTGRNVETAQMNSDSPQRSVETNSAPAQSEGVQTESTPPASVRGTFGQPGKLR